MRAIPVVSEGAGFRVVRDAQGKVEARDLPLVTEYTQAFALTENFYHPNESAADLFAQLVMHDSLGQGGTSARRRSPEKEFSSLRSWFRANLRD